MGSRQANPLAPLNLISDQALNKELMDRIRPELKKYYYDPGKYKSYLDQLGVSYPQLTAK